MSAILSADDLNDFISPGVACIKPVESLPTAPPPPTDDSASLEHEVILDGQGQGQGGANGSSNAPATQISLTDCLACSGCVTSAEAVLVSLQSHSELLHALDGAPGLRVSNDSEDFRVEGLENPDSKLFVASVSPQTRASLAAATRGAGTDFVSERDAGNMVAQLLMGDGGLRAGGRWQNAFTWVVDTNTARDACLVLGAEEVLNPGSGGEIGGADKKKPTLTSSCPGWVCYAEKTHPHVLPHMSRVKSPQALMGTLLKTTLSRRLGIPPDRIWHLAVMPCFDKKLEASREELTDVAWGSGEHPGSSSGGRGVRDVDCVITSKEILMLAESRGLDFFGLSRSPVPASTARTPPFPDPKLRRFLFPGTTRARQRQRQQQSDPAAGTSGGNLHFTLQYVAARHPGATIAAVRGRNVDVVEYTVKGGADGTTPIFRAARYYGFRNIQNLVRRLKPARPSRMPGAGARAVGAAKRPAGGRAAAGSGMEYAYVEVMACPGGCTNGGGQIKVDDPVIIERRGAGAEAKPGPREQKQWLAQVDEAYFSADESAAGDDAEEHQSRLNGDSDDDGDDNDDDDVVGGISPSYIHDTLAHWASITGIDIEKLTRTSFREVVSDVGKNKPSDTERVVQLAGKIGGGW
ncbi:Cytosolic Fe-S cluster assembly factor nar1 [Diatrype stigma]|uniref:Nuclear architecture-related protein 1 n=1 Tax=Diatrype stigma TaxID=117547 RepID=A0AAN9YU54_9PEZI